MSRQLSPQLIYKYDRHQNIPWNIVEYKTPRDYVGLSIKSIPGRHETKKGFFMDQHIKNVQTLPSPNHYNTKFGFDLSESLKINKYSRTNPQLKKNTYIDEIQKEGKVITIGVGSYNIQKTDKQKNYELKQMKKHIKLGRAKRITYFQQKQALSNMVPGSGYYNPHESVVRMKKKNPAKPQTWRKKHLVQSQKQIKLKKKIPGPSSYRPSSAGTFEEMTFELEKTRKKRSLSLNKSFGTDAKFQYCRPIKKKHIQKIPDPSSYNLQIKWRGKNDEKKKIGWSCFVSAKPSTARVYTCI